jgi:hypothetical protein
VVGGVTVRRSLGTLLIVAFCATAQSPAEDAMRSQVRAIGQGYMVEARLADGRKLNGRIGPIAEHDFVLEEIREAKLQNETIAYTGVKSIKRPVSMSKSRRGAFAVIVAASSIGVSMLIRLLLHR